jgi:cytochrome P450
LFHFDPYAPAIDADPFPAYKTLRDDYPCFWSEQAGMWILSRHADIVTALHDWETYSSARGNLMTELPNRAGNTLGTTDPPRHDRLRNLIQHAFTKRNLDYIEDHIRVSARALLAELADRDQFDFVEDFSAKLTVKVLFRLLGLPEGDDDRVRDYAVLMVQSDPVTRQKGPEHIAAFEWVRAYAADVITQRRANPGEDLISQFSLAEIDGDKLDDNEVLLTVTTLIMAGIESLGGFMAMFAYNLANHPDALRTLVNDRSLVVDAIEESLRFNTSAQRFRRNLQTDVALHGQMMKKGDFVCLAYGAGNRDERVFENPDIYDINRKPKGHLGFGGGTHACLGTAIARLSVRLAFDELLQAIPRFTQAEPTLPWMSSSTFRSPLRLMLAKG